MKVFGLIGYPLGHSFSKDYFTKKFSREKITDSIYKNFEMASLDSFTETIKEEKNLIGLNVTIPYKENIIRYLDKVDNVAKEIGSVNVIKVIDNKFVRIKSEVMQKSRDLLISKLRGKNNILGKLKQIYQRF